MAGDADTEQPAPISGPPDVIAERLRAFAGAGITHVQLVVDPITVASVEALGAVLELLDRP
jgi:alkanesulfonate monooxygenase SsuD/methylene tetrahydromethanopterin reductase-like flavin-dependent oxidoreductase (luciferase family)